MSVAGRSIAGRSIAGRSIAGRRLFAAEVGLWSGGRSSSLRPVHLLTVRFLSLSVSSVLVLPLKRFRCQGTVPRSPTPYP